MIIFLLVTTLLLAVCTGFLSYRQLAEQQWRQRAERAWRERQIRRAERRLHDLASDTFIDMMDVARKSSGPGEWHR